MSDNILRKLPSIDELMNTDAGLSLTKEFDREIVVDAARQIVDDLRSAIKRNPEDSWDHLISADAVIAQVVKLLNKRFEPSLRYAVNAAGIILHTGMGRAMLSKSAVDAVNDAIRGYSTLAVDADTGLRAKRDAHVSELLCAITGAEDATIVNNNAAATMLILNTLAAGKEVIVSRGQLVEIGGSFRMPDVMVMSGAVLKEVGTTNKTHLKDYKSAINENTGAILKVHQSNYRIVGFTSEPSVDELAQLSKEHNLPLIDDIGSGALFDLSEFGLEHEPLVQDSVRAGSSVVCFSGDKLIGGPQAGIIIGKKAIIERIRKNPMARALRVDKMTVAAMEATLRLFMNRGKLNESHPVYRMLSEPISTIELRAVNTLAVICNRLQRCAELSIIDDGSLVGSGSVPAQTIPTKVLSVIPKTMSADALALKLRHYSTPIFTRIKQDAVLFDFRTIQPDEDKLIQEALCDILIEEV